MPALLIPALEIIICSRLSVTIEIHPHTLNNNLASRIRLQSKYPSLIAKVTSKNLSTLMNNNSVPNSASQNDIQASLVYQNPQQSMELDQTKLLIKSESHISFYISNNNSNNSNNSIAKLVNKKDNFYLFSIIKNSRTLVQTTQSSKYVKKIKRHQPKENLSQQLQIELRPAYRFYRYCTQHATPFTLLPQSKHSNKTLRGNPQVLSFDKVVGKVYATNIS